MPGIGSGYFLSVPRKKSNEVSAYAWTGDSDAILARAEDSQIGDFVVGGDIEKFDAVQFGSV